MDRQYIAAFTECNAPSYPAFLSVNREIDGRIIVLCRERGHNGDKMVSVEISEADLKTFATTILKSLG